MILAALTAGSVLDDLGRGCAEAFGMLWSILWALVIGFVVTGAIQAFVPRHTMERFQGDHGPRSILLASAFGAASSSCSYAASAMARSMVAKGADFLAAMVFMVASTNLVIELGIVLAVFIGWQFVVAEFVGGAVMIVLLVTLGGLWLRGKAIDAARRRAASLDDRDPGDDRDRVEPDSAGWRPRITSVGGWADAASYTVSDLTMLRTPLVVGVVAAGFLTELVSPTVWSAVFLHGHGTWTTIENAAVGPLVALASFVCSVGNVPLAAALWQGGISFGGVLSFIFGDLITLPLLAIYRRQYGTGVALRMLVTLWVAMSAAGLVVGEAMEAVGLVPHRHPDRVVAAGGVRLDATTFLDVAALVLLGVVYWLYRHRDRFGGGTGYAQDPVCGMQVEVAHAPASTVHDGDRVWFCSEHCRDRFVKHPQRFEVGATHP